ncbi:hypothetical protein GCM10009613_27280 [Pseudonocardia kongjuensis]|uniref:DUF4175 domain-containing protein n=1 Tax=Pseudonocardia kongjuensis TaxID=102227 RepID=A0ABN1XV16_9PSEU
MWKIVGFLVAVYLVFAVLGVIIEGLVWLTVLAGVAFLGTVAYGAIKGRSDKQIR